MAKTLGYVWRKAVIIGARSVALTSPMVCTVICSLTVVLLALSGSWEESMGKAVIMKGLSNPTHTIHVFVIAARVLFVVVGYMNFCRCLQLCYPKYFEAQYDRIH